ncbi:hypothetical protein BJ684DRAFT_14934 [Piptocephalis cylindrospora]|uniref:Uncharacterized protein n=1 Tax=Piptocephalis cylindrospora TaxID=1907219 RepID=A0A4P9Y6P1_9FUNG|nr:hypothetical protein BJ684DRAFT_14934 [Piptocephalis cylindrospora]|eukprot:RKP14758.1 hypothetical protein BJ684DRAFT_14934 [Piptocephalis cylindrospora]
MLSTSLLPALLFSLAFSGSQAMPASGDNSPDPMSPGGGRAVGYAPFSLTSVVAKGEDGLYFLCGPGDASYGPVTWRKIGNPLPGCIYNPSTNSLNSASLGSYPIVGTQRIITASQGSDQLEIADFGNDEVGQFWSSQKWTDLTPDESSTSPLDDDIFKGAHIASGTFGTRPNGKSNDNPLSLFVTGPEKGKDSPAKVASEGTTVYRVLWPDSSLIKEKS